MAIHIEHVTCNIIQMDQTLSQMLLKGFTALCGAFGKEAILGGHRANERQVRQDAKINLTYWVNGPNTLDIAKKGFPDELQGHLLGRNPCYFGGTQLAQGSVKIEFLQVRDKEETAGMGGSKTSSKQ